MANTFQQRAQVRKLIYAALILALFTVSLIHRKLPVYGLDQQAFDLQLREESRGEVSLTSSAVRQVLIGSRGLAVSLLWHSVIVAQDKQNWSEVQMLVDSITMLQPYFIAPWRFQGWNLAFNVSGLCDRPADMYYYIAHGLKLLAEGERRNQGAETEPGKTRFPGNPELRRDIGFFYQMKMGISDQKYVMRCLLDLSCIDPIKRDFENLNPLEKREELLKFCRDHPMLVRRLIEHVGCYDPMTRDGNKIFKFLKDNKDVPSRFVTVKTEGQKLTPLNDPNKQFPILPRPEGEWPNPINRALTNEPVNPYLMARTWYQYAQKPLPPPANFFDSTRPVYPENLDMTQFRRPRLGEFFFRTDPCRAQRFLAESFEDEGWFDGEGWNAAKYLELEQGAVPRVGARAFSGRAAASSAKAVVIGTEPKHQVRMVWLQAWRMFKDTGSACGMYFDDALRRKFESQAAKYRDKYDVKFEQIAPELKNKDDQEDIANRYAHEALRIQRLSHGPTNYDEHLYTCDAKGTSEGVLASKYFYNAQREREAVSPVSAIEQYELAQPIWLHVFLQKPRFARVSTAQEETYETQLVYCGIVQGVKYVTFQNVLIGVSELAPYWICVPPPWSSIPSQKFLGDSDRRKLFAGMDPRSAALSFALLELGTTCPIPWSASLPAQPAWSLRVKMSALGKGEEPVYRPLLSETDRRKVMGPSWESHIRTTRGFFDMVQYYEGPPDAPQNFVPKLKETLVRLTYGASLSPRVPFPYEPELMLTRAPLVEQPPPRNWRNLIEKAAVNVIRSRHQIPPPQY